MTSLGYPYGSCNDMDLEYYDMSVDTYSISRCFKQCQSKALEKSCNCTAPFLPGIDYRHVMENVNDKILTLYIPFLFQIVGMEIKI